jgi:hypothetical protein
MANAYHLICRAFLAPDIGRRPYQSPDGDASRPAQDYAAAARRRLAWTSTKCIKMQIYTKCPINASMTGAQYLIAKIDRLLAPEDRPRRITDALKQRVSAQATFILRGHHC